MNGLELIHIFVLMKIFKTNRFANEQDLYDVANSYNLYKFVSYIISKNLILHTPTLQ